MTTTTSVFRLSNKRWRTRSLFKETNNPSQGDSPPVFTLGDADTPEGLVSLKRKYLEVGDPTEYEFANRCLGGWRHWIAINQSALLRPYIGKWRDELRTKLLCESVSLIRSGAGASVPKQAVDAAKWVREELRTSRDLEYRPLLICNPDDWPLGLSRTDGATSNKRGPGRPRSRANPQRVEVVGPTPDDLEEDFARMMGVPG